MGTGRVVAGQRPAQAVRAYPALPAGLLNDIQCPGGIKAQPFSQSQRLSRTHQVNARQQVVDQLGTGCVARLVADVEHVVRQRIEQIGVLRKHSWRASHHQAHGATRGPRWAARHGRVNGVNAALRKPRGKRLNMVRRHSGAQHDGLAWLQPAR